MQSDSLRSDSFLLFFTAALPQRKALPGIGRISHSLLLLLSISSFPHGRWTLTHFPSSSAGLAAY
jgi:hypothetical protein